MGVLALLTCVVALGGGPLLVLVLPPAQAGGASPKLMPATARHGGTCVVAGSAASTTGTTPPPSVSPHPSAVDVIWLPGLNDTDCKAVLVKGTARIASDLARDIDSARFVPGGRTFFCPFDDGTAARLYFMYGHRSPLRIDAELNGCAWITAPGEGDRSPTSQFRQDLATLAPPRWRSYLSRAGDSSG
jgi:hypothetical protein